MSVKVRVVVNLKESTGISPGKYTVVDVKMVCVDNEGVYLDFELVRIPNPKEVTSGRIPESNG